MLSRGALAHRRGAGRRAGLAAIAAAALLAAGCGSGGRASTSSAATASAATATPAATAAGKGVRLARISRFDAPTYLTGPPGDRQRLFVAEKSGVIRVLVNGRVQPQPFLDIHQLVNASGTEQGLLSLAFAPGYQTNHRFYVYYTGENGDVHVVQYRRSARSANLADAGSGRNVITIPHHAFANHNGGQLQFGPDGDLYVGVGDGGSEGDPDNNGQNTSVLLAKILRIKPGANGGYSIPGTNPFFGQPGKRPEIWAYGLRNPWRFSFDRLTGSLIIGDVGQDQEEEIDFAEHGTGAGANYGWSVFEGDRRYKPGHAPGAVAPILVLRHSDGYCAVIGGYVVRDRSLPALYGRYVYGDDCNPRISSARVSEGHAAGNAPTALSVPQIASFGQDAQGRVYVVSLAGPVYRLVAG